MGIFDHIKLAIEQTKKLEEDAVWPRSKSTKKEGHKTGPLFSVTGHAESDRYRRYNATTIKKSHENEVISRSGPVAAPIADRYQPGNTMPKRWKSSPHPLAVKWIEDHREQLANVGYTRFDFANEVLPLGIWFLDIWEKSGLRIDLVGEVLIFSYRNAHGAEIVQTCRPEQRGA